MNMKLILNSSAKNNCTPGIYISIIKSAKRKPMISRKSHKTAMAQSSLRGAGPLSVSECACALKSLTSSGSWLAMTVSTLPVNTCQVS